MVLSGWVAVAAFALAGAMLAAIACGIAMRSFASTVAVIALAFPGTVLFANLVVGDVSKYLPPHTFADGFEGLNQIMTLSIAGSILGGITLSALVVGVIARVHATVRAPAA
jgi:hypothetical protein